MPQTVSKNSPSTNVLPSTSRPSATKKAVTTSRSATVRPTWSKRRTCDIGPSSRRRIDRRTRGGRRRSSRTSASNERTERPIDASFAITFIACFVGLSGSGGAEGVGRTTTNAVVATTIALMLLDVLLVPVLKAF